MGVVLNWSSNYPSSKDTISTNYPSLSDGVHDVLASHVNSLANASVEIQKVVGGLRNAPIQDPLSLSDQDVLSWSSANSRFEPASFNQKVDGPASTTDRAIPTWNGAGGILLRDNPVLITSGGHIDVGGNNITNVGTVDSRNVSADGTKLDGIESGATENGNAVELDIDAQFSFPSVDVVSPENSDFIVLEDSSDSKSKKGTQIGSLPFIRQAGVVVVDRSIPVFSGTGGANTAATPVVIDSNDQLITQDVQVQGRSHGDEVSVAFSTTLTIDLSTGNKFVVGAMTADLAITLANGTAGQYFEIILVQDGDGTDQTVTSWTAGTGMSSVQKPIGENLTPHTGNGAITSIIGECDTDGASVLARIRKATDSGWETA